MTFSNLVRSVLVAAILPSAGFAGPATSVNIEGVANFQKVDDHVYRGAQPTRCTKPGVGEGLGVDALRG